jgi:hypothetical protein
MIPVTRWTVRDLANRFHASISRARLRRHRSNEIEWSLLLVIFISRTVIGKCPRRDLAMS